MSLMLAVHATGEAFGYLFGTGSCEDGYARCETRRDRFGRLAELALWS
jgi:hypothetical protein